VRFCIFAGATGAAEEDFSGFSNKHSRRSSGCSGRLDDFNSLAISTVAASGSLSLVS